MSNQDHLRLIFPQWQGGANPTYHLGAKLTHWLAPRSDATVLEIPVDQPHGELLPVVDGVTAKPAVLDQNRAAARLLEQHAPSTIVVFGGDCSVSLVPFAYLANKYQGDIAVLWVDSHPDCMDSRRYKNSHTYVMGNILGKGDREFSALCPSPIPPSHLCYVGVGRVGMNDFESDFIKSNGITLFEAHELSEDFAEVTSWQKALGVSKVMVHFDLDSLDPALFRAQLFNNPNSQASHDAEAMATGKMSMGQVADLLDRVAEHGDVVGLSVTEHMPWDAENLRNGLARLPLMNL